MQWATVFWKTNFGNKEEPSDEDEHFLYEQRGTKDAPANCEVSLKDSSGLVVGKGNLAF